MGKIFRNLIEYSGINEYPYDNLKNFKQATIDNNFCIPSEKPDIEQLVKVSVKSDIVHKEIVKTPIGTSFEGQESTGFKLLISGDIDLRIEYSAKNISQSIHTVHTKFPFCDYVVLPKSFSPTAMVFPTISIEDIYSEKFDCRCIYNNISLLLVVDLC